MHLVYGVFILDTKLVGSMYSMDAEQSMILFWAGKSEKARRQEISHHSAQNCIQFKNYKCLLLELSI